jgi:flagellar protein FliS
MAFGSDARAEYFRDSIVSASPAQQLAMLFDRLLLDLQWAEKAQEQTDWLTASKHLGHAQAIIAELTGTLRVDLWSGGPALMSLYVYVAGILRTGNAWHDIAPTREAIELLEPLRVSWHVAIERTSAPTESARLSAVG